MSLFFLILTIVTFMLSHWMARFSKPGNDFIYVKRFKFKGSKERLVENIHNWINQSSSQLLIHEDGEEFVIHQEASFLSYGYFYHLRIIPIQENKKYDLEFKIEAKLISSAKEHHFFNPQRLKLLELHEDIDYEETG